MPFASDGLSFRSCGGSLALKFCSPIPSMPSFTILGPSSVNELSSDTYRSLSRAVLVGANDEEISGKTEAKSAGGTSDHRILGIHNKRNRTIGVGKQEQLDFIVAESVITNQLSNPMDCKINSFCTTIPGRSSPGNLPKNPAFCFSPFCSKNETGAASGTAVTRRVDFRVDFKTLGASRLGIARYPDFEYDAQGGTGTGTSLALQPSSEDEKDEIPVSFDLETVYIPPLTSATTKFLGLPLPPFFRIDIVPEFFQGSIGQESGKVGLRFKAKFCFSVGSIYRAPPLIVETVLTSEESSGKMRGGRGERLDEEGKCRLVGVATVEPIEDFLMNSFLGLPTECLADLRAVISLSGRP